MSGDQSSVISTTRPKEICWIDSQITSIKSLKLHSNLVTLNLHSNHISKIEGLQHLQNLRHLDLSSNQISHIEGLTSLGYLRVLNLSCNRIYLVEGLENLRKLTKLDLSYNFIENVSGLKDLHGNGYSLTTLYLHGNRIASLEHFISSVIGCISLKELTLQMYGEGNHVCNVSGYRDGVLSAMPGLAVLDGYDRTGRAAALNDDLDIPELEEYIQYLQSSSSCEIKTSDSSSSKETRFDVVTPRIDQVLNRFKQRGPLPSDSEQSSVNISPPSQEQARDRQIQGIQPPVDHEVRLGILENLLANFVTSQPPSRVQRKTEGNKQSDDSESEQEFPSKEAKTKPVRTVRSKVTLSKSKSKTHQPGSKRAKVPKTTPQSSSSSTSPTTPREGVGQDREVLKVRGKQAIPTRTVRPPEDDATLMSLIQELEAERERRWKAEQAGRKLVDHIKTLQTKGLQEKNLQEAALAASARLKEALVKEREIKAELKGTVSDLQNKNTTLTDEVERLRESNEAQRTTLRDMEDSAGRMETERIKQHAHEVARAQEYQMAAAAANREVELLKHAVKQHKGQLQQLQELLASREQQHKVAMEGMVKNDSREMREAIEREMVRQEARHEQELQQYKQRLDKRDAEYSALEDEFRMALQIEANRFKELQEAFERVSEEAAQQKHTVQTASQKETKAVNMVNELTAMVKEQRGRLTELSRGKQEVVAEYKDRIQTLEGQLNDARRQLNRLETLEQDKSKLAAQIRAQESVIEGLRTERKLWSQELAQQGASLASDRGRLESRIEVLTAELNQMKKQSQSDNETIRIKAKLIEDQTDSTRKLRQALSERENEIKRIRDENAKQVADLEQKLASELTTSTELQDEVDALRQRKDELKTQLRDSQEELEKTKDGLRSLRSKWQEKSGLITQMESEVVQMRDNFKEKEKTLTEERDKAITAASASMEKLKSCDDAFRRQLESVKHSHEKEVDRIHKEKQSELDQANQRVLEVEDEMRQLLQENALTKKTLEKRINKLTSAFTEIQQDLAT